MENIVVVVEDRYMLVVVGVEDMNSFEKNLGYYYNYSLKKMMNVLKI
jgi:hypothetical protein